MDSKEIINGILEDQGLDQNQIADIMAEISEINTGELDPTTPPRGVDTTSLENSIRDRMAVETDWRVKASLAARIISLNLE